MKHGKQVLEEAKDIVNNYAEYDHLAGCYVLGGIEEDYYLAGLSAKLMQQNDDYALECVSLENPYFKDFIIPSIVNMMKSDDYENKDVDIINGAIIKYQMPVIKELLYNALDDFNQDKGYTK